MAGATEKIFTSDELTSQMLTNVTGATARMSSINSFAARAIELFDLTVIPIGKVEMARGFIFPMEWNDLSSQKYPTRIQRK